MSSDDEWRPSCYECGREMARRNLQPTPVHIHHDDEPGYDRVNVPMCHGCRLEMFPTHECEHCGEEYLDISDAVECCQHRQGRPMPDGGDVEMAAIDRLEQQLGGEFTPAYILASELPKAHGIPKSEMQKILSDEWTDDGETWEIHLNGSGRDWYPKVTPVGDEMPDPCAVEMFNGAHLVKVGGEALAILHPTHVEYFTDRDVTKPWGSAILHALRDRLVDLGEDLPPVSELAKEVDDGE